MCEMVECPPGVDRVSTLNFQLLPLKLDGDRNKMCNSVIIQLGDHIGNKSTFVCFSVLSSRLGKVVKKKTVR